METRDAHLPSLVAAGFVVFKSKQRIPELSSESVVDFQHWKAVTTIKLLTRGLKYQATLISIASLNYLDALVAVRVQL
jgi:hypothetical protein